MIYPTREAAEAALKYRNEHIKERDDGGFDLYMKVAKKVKLDRELAYDLYKDHFILALEGGSYELRFSKKRGYYAHKISNWWDYITGPRIIKYEWFLELSKRRAF